MHIHGGIVGLLKTLLAKEFFSGDDTQRFTAENTAWRCFFLLGEKPDKAIRRRKDADRARVSEFNHCQPHLLSVLEDAIGRGADPQGTERRPSRTSILIAGFDNLCGS